MPEPVCQPPPRVRVMDEEPWRVLMEPVELAADPTAVRSGRRVLVQVCQAGGTAAHSSAAAVRHGRP